MNQERVAELFAKQQEIGKSIANMHDRFGKENRNRRNKLTRLLEWRGKFNEEWTKFLDNHDILKDKFEQLKYENYFKENYYEFIKAYYQSGLTKIALEETIQRRKEGLPTIDEEPELGTVPETENQGKQFENELSDDQNDDDLENAGFVTTMGEHLQGQSTPKREFFDDMNKINKFLTSEKILTLKLNEIEQLAMHGLKTRAKIILTDIEEVWKKFHSEMEGLCSVTSEYEKDYYETYQQVANRYYQALEEMAEPVNKNANQNAVHVVENTQVKLEPLKIPKFRGTYETWPTFSSLFDTLIIANKSLTDVQRMQYLKSVVTDEADRAIASLTIIGEKFPQSMENIDRAIR